MKVNEKPIAKVFFKFHVWPEQKFEAHRCSLIEKNKGFKVLKLCVDD